MGVPFVAKAGGHPGYKSRSPCRLSHAAAPVVPASAAQPWSRLLQPTPPQANVSSSHPSRYQSLPCCPSLFLGRELAGAAALAVAAA
jgi:hypothetical protein